jgi:sec-independent protein translocase protein TatA
MFENIGMGELLIILLVVLIFFGPKKIPEMAQGIGKGMREFKKAIKGAEEDLKSSINTDPNDDKTKGDGSKS